MRCGADTSQETKWDTRIEFTLEKTEREIPMFRNS